MQVTIVCNCLRDAKKLRDIIGKHDSALCYVETEAQSFGDSSDLYLVDVEKDFDCEGKNVAFYYPEGKTPLPSLPRLASSCAHFCLDDQQLPEKLMAVLESLKAKEQREKKFQKMGTDLSRLRRKHKRMLEGVEQIKQVLMQRHSLEKLVVEIERECRCRDFFEALTQVLERCSFIHHYALFELTSNGQKLVCPKLSGKKYEELPTLSLGDDHPASGIRPYARGAAHQVAADHLGLEVVSMGVRGRTGDDPHLLVYLTGDSWAMEGLNWNLLQTFLSGLYSRSLAPQSRQDDPFTRFISEWEFYDLLVDKGGVQQKPYGIVTVEFHQLVAAIAKKGEDHFQWGRFYEGLIHSIEKGIQHDYRATALGRWAIAFFVSEEYVESLEGFLLGLAEKFPYWQFFDEPDDILALDLNPKIKVLSAFRREFFDYLAQNNGKEAEHRRLDQRREEVTL